uniref:hypothetical protein n=3 Tax=Legionella pneumophila TaxID=446 RepID=UPI000517CFC9
GQAEARRRGQLSTRPNIYRLYAFILITAWKIIAVPILLPHQLRHHLIRKQNQSDDVVFPTLQAKTAPLHYSTLRGIFTN